MALKVFPKDVADEIKKIAEKATFSCAEVKMGSQGRADVNSTQMKDHLHNLKQIAQDLISDHTCNNIQEMFSYSGWHTANTRVGNDSDAARDKTQVEDFYQQIIKSGELDKTLAENVKSLGWNCAWYAANSLKAIRDKANIESDFLRIQGEVNLVCMNFIMDKAEMLSQKTQIVTEQTLNNNTDVQQSMTFTFTTTNAKTNSVSHTISFSYGIKVDFSAGFFCFADSKYEAYFNFSHRHTFDESINTTTTKSYQFPIQVPPHTSYKAKGMVHEANMNVPYELVFDFGGTKRTIKGIWNGVAVSEATCTYQVDKV